MNARTMLPMLCLLAAVPAAGKPLRSAELKLTLGRPVQDGPIAVVPIICEGPIGKEKYITLAEATKRGLVEIVEVPGGAEVNTLQVRNRAELPLALFAGELLLGSKQDRIVAKDILVPPGDTRPVPVFCVEHGRWEDHRLSFQGADTFVPDSVRAAAVSSQSQTRVWAKVAQVNEAAKARSSTGTVRAMLATPQVQRRVNGTTARLRAAFAGNPRVVGVICWLNGRVHTADLFANPALFTASRDKVLRGYVADVETGATRNVPVDIRACQRFLNRIVTARRTVTQRGRFETEYGIQGGGLGGYESGVSSIGSRPPSTPMAGRAGFLHGNYRPQER